MAATMRSLILYARNGIMPLNLNQGAYELHGP
jgi:hypothetical protein